MSCGVVAAAVVGNPFTAAVCAVPVGLYWYVGIKDMTQKKHTVLRNFPVLGHVRFVLEGLRVSKMQFFYSVSVF